MMSLNKSERKLALVVVDMQKKFTHHQEPDTDDMKRHIEVINKTSKMFRDAGRTVIFIKFDGDSHGPYTGPGNGDDYHDSIISEPSDIVVHKNHMNSFLESDLAKVVKETGHDTILLCGTVTQYCVLGTYYGASDHGLIAYLLHDGCVSKDENINVAAEIVCKTYNEEEIVENLAKVKIE